MKKLLKKLYVEDTMQIDVDVTEDVVLVNGQKIGELQVDVIRTTNIGWSRNRLLWVAMTILVAAFIASIFREAWYDTFVLFSLIVVNLTAFEKTIDLHITPVPVDELDDPIQIEPFDS